MIELTLPNISVSCGRVEQYHPSIGFAAIVSRAFSELADFVGLTRHLLGAGGRWLAMKGVWPHDEIERLPADVRLDVVHRLQVPEVRGSVIWSSCAVPTLTVGGVELAKILAVTDQKGGVGKTTDCGEACPPASPSSDSAYS